MIRKFRIFLLDSGLLIRACGLFNSQLHRRICVLHQGLVSLQIAASKWQNTYDEEEKNAIAELTTLQSEVDQREIERDGEKERVVDL